MELLTDFFSNEYKTGKHNLPSIKNYIDSLKMSSYDSYEDSLKYILSNIPENCKKTFFDTLHHINPSHMKFHHEPYGWHALCCGHIASHYAKLYGGDSEIAFKLGFLHDIGKPFCETPLGITFAHGQIGSHLADFILKDIELELKEVLLFIIDQHMCVCTHHVGEYNYCYEVLHNLHCMLLKHFLPLHILGLLLLL